MQYLGAISKRSEWSWLISKGKQFNITVLQVYAQTTDAEEAEVDLFYVQDLEPPPKKIDVLLIIEEWNAKVGNQRSTHWQAILALEYKIKQGLSRE